MNTKNQFTLVNLSATDMVNIEVALRLRVEACNENCFEITATGQRVKNEYADHKQLKMWKATYKKFLKQFLPK